MPAIVGPSKIPTIISPITIGKPKRLPISETMRDSIKIKPITVSKTIRSVWENLDTTIKLWSEQLKGYKEYRQVYTQYHE